jgi:hypothetical protein
MTSMPNWPRIRPYKTFAVSGRGALREVKAYELTLERPASVATGGDLEINLAPHPTFKGWVSFATFRSGGLTIEPASSSHAYLLLHDMPIQKRHRRPAASPSRGSRQHVYLVDATGRKTTTTRTTYIVRLGRGRDLRIDLAPLAPWASHVMVESSTGKLSVHLNAGNVIFFGVV